ncbi:hypothetical protein JKF63_04164 [Porcisia hertigi]|uniref:Guanine nucleotide-binding protein-like 1 n=1 Tax=Porcisia hertigi TaxID=2761500 RepID=A0A836I2U5_9TRYP|nr:hypothetical protein JKF63_04164 [Porcisia hertigi]
MPPFSGKKKKEQLQAKRQRKRDETEHSKARDREREKMREELMKCGKDVSDEVLDALLRERADPQDHTTRERRSRPKGNNEADAVTSTYRKVSGSAKGGDDECGSSGPSSSESGNERGDQVRSSAPLTVMYSADRPHGVRSAFVKESAAAIATRRQLSYQPIPCRTTMPPTGIAFGDWFTFPSSALSATAGGSTVSADLNDRRGGARAGASEAPRSGEEKLAFITAEQERRMNRPLVASAGDALGGVTSSSFFPFSVELPSRGWHVDHESGAVLPEPSTVMTGECDATKQVHNDHLKGAAPRAALGSPASLQSQDRLEKTACALQSNSSQYEATDVTGSSTDTSEAHASAAVTKIHSYDAHLIKNIEWKRFGIYTQFVDAYPLPAALTGLEVSSFERNLEVWQQLWRTVELSDVLVVVADARYPIIHAHLGLLTYIAKEQRKPCVLLLNKEDLVPASTLRCWQQFLYRYLDDLGFSVEQPDTAGQPSERGTEQGTKDGVAHKGAASGRIVLRTFTANPRPETAGQRSDEVDVARRQKSRRKANAHMYEKLRTGRLNVAKHLGDCRRDAEDGSDDEEEDELRYSSTEIFVGVEAAQRALQQDRRAYKELEAVSAKITELLATCRRLGATSRTTAREGDSAAGEEPSTALPSSRPCAARRAAPKNKKAKQRSAARRGGAGRSGGQLGDSAGDGSDNESSDDVVEDRAPDCSSYLHIGFVGHPNVGKSSLLNCIRGTKVVSVSATPGHTKHVQTIPVPEEHLTLVDSPGLALPVFGVPRPLQAVLGTHQIAQTRDPQTSISFLAAYLPIEKMYGLQRPEYALQESGWSSYELCEAYAKKRGLFVKRGKGALDTHRAAIALLQEAYEGQLTLFYAPPELNLLQSAWYRERIRPHLLLPVFEPIPC